MFTKNAESTAKNAVAEDYAPMEESKQDAKNVEGILFVNIKKDAKYVSIVKEVKYVIT